MTYVALLRGVNVGGNNKVEMAKLKMTMERLGFSNVKTLIASGNVIFCAASKDIAKLTKQIESAIENDFSITISVVVRGLNSIEELVKTLPDHWVNDKDTKCDVMFLWDKVDSPDIIDKLPHNPDLEDVIYYPGAVIWRIDRDKASKSRMLKIVGTPLHKQMTIRNPNTVRKLYQLMLEAEKAEAGISTS